MNTKITVPKLADTIFRDIHDHGGEVYLVGGFVRDHIMKRESKDIDVEIYHLSYRDLTDILSSYGAVLTFGESFAVTHLSTLPNVEFALPRKEKKTGNRHQDFDIIVEPDLPLEQASSRRDFTCNALMYDYFNETIKDFHGGIEDIKNGILEIVDSHTFIEDPLRVLRAASFISRLEFKASHKTLALCREMVKDYMLEELSLERINEEYDKILMSSRPSLGFAFLKDINALPDYLKNLIGCYQRPDYHPEGDVWNHTMLVIDIAALVKNKASDPLGFMWGSLLHDIGKPAVTDQEGHAYRHAEVGADIFNHDVKLIPSKRRRLYVRTLIYYHMRLMQLFNGHSRPIKYKKLLKHIENKCPLNDLILITKCDKLGRGYLSYKGILDFELYMSLMKVHYGDKAEKPIIGGADLINSGFTDHHLYKKLIHDAYNYQLSGMRKETILRRLEKDVKKSY